MTAKKLAEEALKAGRMRDLRGGDYHFRPEEFETFCHQLCKEQRISCRDNAETTDLVSDCPDYDHFYYSILNSPMPEL